jgi:hypothetical protein
MSAQPAPANLHTEPGQHAANAHAADTHATDAQYYRHALHDLIDLGSDLARLLHQQASAQAAQQAITQAHAAPQDPAPQPAPAPAPDALTPDTLISIAAAFDRIARAIRRSIALARSLADPAPPAKNPAQHRAAARRRILREVEDTIQRMSPGSDDADFDAADADDASADALTAELHDRLDAPDLDDDVSSRPVADIITEICRDLGLAVLSGAHPWKRRTPADLEQLRARAAAPSAARQPSAGPHSVPATSRPAPTNPVPPGPAAIPRATSPAHADSDPPDDPAETPARVATIPRHPMHLRAQWRPPPDPKQTSAGPHR